MNNLEHTVNHINIVNPELGGLIKRAETVHLITGGKQVSKQKSKKLPEYESLRLEINSRVENIQKLQENIDSGIYDKDSRNYIAMKNRLRGEYTDLASNVSKFKEVFNLLVTRRLLLLLAAKHLFY